MTDVTVSAQWLRWVEAGRVLGRQPNAQVPCPRQGDQDLQVTDVVAGPGQVERYLHCPGCGATNIMRLAPPGEVDGGTR